MSKEGTIWIVIGVYALFMLGIGVWYSRKGTDMEGFTVGGRNAGAWISALSYGTAYFSAVMFIGYSGGSGWSYGLWSVLVGVGNAVFGTLLAWLVLANRTRDLTRRHHIQSMPQLFEKRHGDRPPVHPADVLSIAVDFPLDEQLLRRVGHPVFRKPR